MKHLVIILAFLSLLPLKSRANMDCVYISSQKGITIKYTSPCFGKKYQAFIDSFLNKIVISLSRSDSINEILVLVNFEQLYFDDSKVANFHGILVICTSKVEQGLGFPRPTSSSRHLGQRNRRQAIRHRVVQRVINPGVQSKATSIYWIPANIGIEQANNLRRS